MNKATTFDIIQSSPWPKASLLSVLALLGINVALAIWGCILSFVFSYAEGVPYGNFYTGVWINALAWILTAQSVAVLLNARLVTARPARFYAWCWYIAWMFACTIILLVGMHYRELISQYAWAFLWLPPIGVMAAAVQTHRSTLRKDQPKAAQDDVEASAAKPKTCSPGAWRKCWFDFWAFCGWSSMFWLSFLGFFLALQAAWLVHDQRIYPAPGNLYQIDLETGSNYRPNIHMACKGPTDTRLSTFILEAGGGAPGIIYAGIVDELAAAGRRACWYDRLGYGWSDDALLYGTADQATKVLYNTLKAAGETGPYIIAGHSAGGQLAMLFHGYHPQNVSGIALLDSMDNVAISLAYTGSDKYVDVTLPSGRKAYRPALTYLTADRASLVDVVRAITPLGWARFITTSHDNYPYRGAANAVYGNNKEWHAQWVGIKEAVHGVTDDSDILSDLAYQQSNGTRQNLWRGTAWPDLSPKPVLLLPAEKTLEGGMPDGCNVFDLPNNVPCQNKVVACTDRKCVYANLYVTYLRTLSTNTSMKMMPGGHGYPRAIYKETAAALLAKFAGV